MRARIKRTAHAAVDALEWLMDFRTPPSLPLKQRLELDLGFYEVGTTRFFKRRKPHGVVMDIGAHIGYYSRIAARTAVRVYAFEPDPDNFALLERNVRRFSNIVPLRIAISNRNGEAALYKVPDSTFRHSLIPEQEGLKQVLVTSMTLDSFIAQHGITDIGLIKIDVEQAEPLVFEGMRETLRHKPCVVFESGGDAGEVQAIARDGRLVPLAGATYYGAKRKVTNVVLNGG